MIQISNRHFVDEKIDCDGVHFHNCLLDGCILVATRAGKEARFTGTSCVLNCKLIGDGWPQNVLTLNATHLAQYRLKPKPEHEATLTRRQRAALGRRHVDNFVLWLTSRGFQ